MYSVVLGVDLDEVETEATSAADLGNWKHDYVRVFLSHSADHKNFVGEIASELAVVGIHGYVAHDTMEYTKPWQTQIEMALATMQAFVAIIHPGFNESPWCQAEAGWALGRRIPHYAVRMGSDPAGFLGRDQWPSCVSQTAAQVARVVAKWVTSLPGLGTTMFDGLLAALESSGNYMDAGATANRIAALGTLSEEQFDRIDKVWWTNDQLFGGLLPTRAMKPLYLAHARAWPPPKPIRD
jgi:hypothetical protein